LSRPDEFLDAALSYPSLRATALREGQHQIGRYRFSDRHLSSIGALPASVQTVIKAFPVSHAAALFRQV
jgi:hypothetical protein